MVRPGLINLDFADVRAVMDEMGKAMMGTGEAEGEDRAVQAAEKAIANPLLDEISLEGAKGVLINITGGYDLTLFELDEAANKIREKVDGEANIIVGSTLDTGMEGKMRVSVVATGIDAAVSNADTPLPRRSMASPLATPLAMETPAPAPVQQEAPVVTAEVEQVQPTFAELEVPAVPAPHLAQQPAAFQPQAEPSPAPRPAEAVDELPPPAYTPRSVPENLSEADTFVAPRAPAQEAAAPGTPTPEAMARLQAAVSRVPGQEPAAPASDAEGEKPRFGINSLINRMTGAQTEGSAPQPAPARAQPQVTAIRQEPEAIEEQEKIEIPAFLRRQAN